MPSYVDELSLKLTAKDEMSSRLKGLRKELTGVEKDMAKARAELERTGSKEAAAELKKLEQRWTELTRAQAENRKESAANEAAMKRLRVQAEQSQSAAAKAGRAWKQTASVFGNDLIAGASAAGLYLGGKQLLGAYASAEAMQAQLDLAYQKFPATANLSIAALRDYNDELMRSTGADDDALASAEALLAKFGLTGQQIRQLIPLVNDLAIAKGVDLTTAAEAVGKATLGQAKALKSVGIEYKATGNATRDMASLQELLAEKVGGTGDAFGKTAAGGMQAASKQFENLQENLGQQLVPAMNAFLDVAEPAMGIFDRLPDGAKATAVGIGFVSAAALIATPRLMYMNSELVKMGRGGFLGIAKSGKGAALGIAGVTAAMVALSAARGDAEYNWTPWEGTFQGIAGVNNAMAGLTKGTLDTEAPFLATIADNLNIVQKQSSSAKQAVSLFDSQLIDLVSQGKQSEADRLFNSLADGAKSWGGSVDDVRKLLPGYSRALDTATGSMSDFEQKTNTITSAMNRFSHSLDVRDALAAWKKAQADFVAKPSKDTAEAAARAYESVVGAYKEGGAAQAKFVQSNTDEMTAIISKSGFSNGFKAQVTDSLALANTEAQALLATMDQVTRIGSIPSGAVRSEARRGLWNGGAVTGPGTTTSDSVPAMLSRGEWVLRASSVAALERQYGTGFMSSLNNADRSRARLPQMPAPRSSTPRIVVKAGATIGSMQTHVTASGQIDYELAQRRTARQMARESRARYAGSRS